MARSPRPRGEESMSAHKYDRYEKADRYKLDAPEEPPQSEDLLLRLLTLPILGIPMFVQWIGEQVKEAVEQELYNEEAVEAELVEWELRYDLGEISEEEYMEAEEALLARMKAIREHKQAASAEG